jgi:hypothetical protein
MCPTTLPSSTPIKVKVTEPEEISDAEMAAFLSDVLSSGGPNSPSAALPPLDIGESRMDFGDPLEVERGEGFSDYAHVPYSCEDASFFEGHYQ